MSSYIPIASQTLGSSASSVTFSSIPTTLNGKTLRDLVLIATPIGTVNQFEALTFNGDTGANYNLVWMSGNGSTAASSGGSGYNNIINDQGWDSVRTTYGTQFVYNIFDYSQTNKHKSVLLRTNRADFRTVATAARWANTAAITSITFVQVSGNLAAGSTFSLYGIEG